MTKYVDNHLYILYIITNNQFYNKLNDEDFSVLANETNDFRIKLQENLLIHPDGPRLNKTSVPVPLMLFS